MKKVWKVCSLVLVMALMLSVSAFAAEVENSSQFVPSNRESVMPLGMVVPLDLDGAAANQAILWSDACGEYSVGNVTLSGSWSPTYAKMSVKFVDANDTSKSIITTVTYGSPTTIKIPYSTSWNIYVTPNYNITTGTLNIG